MADTTHSKMGSQYREVHNTHRNIQGRSTTRRWVLNTKKYTIHTETCAADTTHSKMGSQYREVHNTCRNIHGRSNPLEDGFSIPKSTQYAQKHTRQIQPTRRWVLNTKKYTIRTETYMADTTHSKMGSQYREVHNTCRNIHGRYNPLEDGFSIPRNTQYTQKHNIRGRYNPLEDGFSIPKSTQYTQRHARQIQPTRRWVLNTEKYTIHTETCAADTTHLKMGSQYREIHNTHRNIIYVADTTHSKMGSQYQKVHNTHRDMRGRYNPLEDGFSIPKGTQYARKHTWQIQPTRRWVLNTEKYTIRTETYKADTTNSKMGSQYREVHSTNINVYAADTTHVKDASQYRDSNTGNLPS